MWLVPLDTPALLTVQVTSEYAKAYLMVYDQVGGLVAILDKLMGSHEDEAEE
eukprot:SAG31_NODE_14795_length_787_cov_1.042151_2_plen_52_part_00